PTSGGASSSPAAPVRARPPCSSWCASPSASTCWCCPSRPASCSAADFPAASARPIAGPPSARSFTCSASWSGPPTSETDRPSCCATAAPSTAPPTGPGRTTSGRASAPRGKPSWPATTWCCTCACRPWRATTTTTPSASSPPPRPPPSTSASPAPGPATPTAASSRAPPTSWTRPRPPSACSAPPSPIAAPAPRCSMQLRHSEDRSGPDGHLHHAVALVGEQVVSGLDLVQPEGVGHQLAEGEPLGGHHAHQAAHALLSARAQGGHDPVIAQPGREGVERHVQVARVDAQARQRAPGADAPERVLEGRL